MEQTKANSPRLFVCTAIENKDEIEERYERAYNFFQSLVADCSEKEAHDALNNAVCKNHEDVSLGMLMSILTEPHNATKCYRDLTLVTRDGLTCVLNNLSNLILERYLKFQDTTRNQYLATPESQTLRSDMIRFIVGVIHPTNELLCSDIIPRWAVIGWLLTTCTSNVAASNAKLALFYDWLFYDPEKDNIMNIEPAILVMHHSMRSHPAVTATLLDFLCRIIPNFYPPFADKVKQGIFNSLQQIIEKRVLPNLQPLFDSPKLDRELRTTVRDTFKEFCSNGNGEGVSGIREDGNDDLPRGGPDEPAFSDDEDEPQPIIAEDTDDDDLPLSEVRARERPELAAALPLILRPFAETLLDDRSSSAATALLNACTTPMPTPIALADLFAATLQDASPLRITRNPSPSELEQTLNSPIFSLFNCLHSSDVTEVKRKLILETLKEIYVQSSVQNVGYCLLFYLKVCFERERRAERDPVKKRNVKFKADVYKDYCSFLELKIAESLADDFEKCQESDANVLVWLIPDVYREFKDQVQNHIRLLHIIVSTLDAGQLQRLVCLTLQGNLMMFKSDDITTMLSTSLSWETFEQYCLWQLLTAHEISVEDVLPIIPKLSYKDHAEALTSVLLMLKQERPTGDVLRQMFCRPVDEEDTFVVSTVMYWCQDYEDKVADLLAVLLSTRYPGTSPNKRKRPGKHNIPPNAPPSAELVLGHLEQIRICCVDQDDMSIFNMECLQKALQQSQSNSSDSLKRQYNELFLLAWEDELPISRRARKLVSNSLPINPNLHSSNEDSEEEEIVKPKQAKRRKKAISDSD
ncbi:integrator complex subunit 3 homolog isoform X2 [Vanessa atalanta]|uniref:integrator complex subunit 3 homolog isoform X2 n=1 Tax=Vanessa atalanta TaxID=42275 RepID=UPI001FCD8E73|nr:integrator complex subunit 3 homolog isoform X2 [Vanessa atalanta]